MGQDDDDVSLRNYKLHMKMFEFCHRLYPSVKYSLHAGELTRLTAIPEAYKDDDYKMPFFMLLLVVNQVYIQMKECF